MKILYVEDNPVDIDLTVRHLKKTAPHITVEPVRSQTEALKRIQDPDFLDYDLVLSDMHLQDGDGITVLSFVRSHSIPTAVVILTGQGDEQSAVAALKSGADDYIVKKKGYLDHLPSLLEAAIASYQKGKERKNYQLRVLYIEHNQADIDLTIRHFQKHAAHISLDAVSSVKEFYEALDSTDLIARYNVLLLDYRLPLENALDVLKRIRQSPHEGIPVILVTGKGDEEIAVMALKLGAFDYVTKHKGYLFKLPSIIENAFYSWQLTHEHQALEESERRYRSLFEDNKVAMLLIDAGSGRIVDANLAAVDFYGWSREELCAKKIEEITVSTPDEIAAKMNAAEKEKRGHLLLRHRRCDGSVRDVEMYSGDIDIKGRSLRYLLLHDVTQSIETEKEKRKLQEQLNQAQKMEALGTLAGGIAHDFNNVLGVILGYTEFVKEQATPDSQIQEDLDQVLIAAKRAKDLVKQILAFSRQALVERIPIKIQPLLKEGLKMLRSSIPSTISINEDIDPKSGIILAAPSHIHQILMNLCTNAYHAMEKTGGTLSISLKTAHITADSKKKMLLDSPPGEYVEIAVSDTGCGIGPDILDKIFDPYFTTKEVGKGTGLGLAIIYGILSEYGGAISVETQLGKGTTFHVYFPVLKEDVLPDIKESDDIPRGEERILFVDDEKLLADLGGTMLARLGYKTTVALNGFEALEYFRKTPEQFDLVITDQTMPGMTGVDLARRLLEIRPEVPIILCTGYSNLVDAESAKAIGIREFALKPLTTSAIATLIRQALDAAGPAS